LLASFICYASSMKLPSLGRARFILGALIISSPLLAFAQTDTGSGTVTDVPSLFTYALDILNGYVVPIIFAIAFVFFIFGVYRYFIAGGGNAEKVQEGQKFVLWSIIGFVIMFSIWGIINLFINTLGFGTSAQPQFPTFNGGSGGSLDNGGGSLGSEISNLFGGNGSNGSVGTCSDGSTPVNGVCDNGLLSSGGMYSSGGINYPITGANTVQAINGNCPNNYSLISGTSNCGQIGSTAGGTISANGTVGPGGTCSTDTNCADGANGQSYGCYKAGGSGNGICSVDGDAPANGTVAPGGACTNDISCQDVGSQSYGCFQGICTADGDANANGSVPDGGSCAGNENACQNGSTCNTATATCVAVSEDGSQGAGGSCADNEDACGQGLLCSPDTDTCVAVPQDGAVGQGGSCLGNENACGDGLTCGDNDICTPDANVNNGNTTVSCNDGSTQDSDVGCGDDCGQVGSTNTCNVDSGNGGQDESGGDSGDDGSGD
jgi:Type IV secretion system pilin